MDRPVRMGRLTREWNPAAKSITFCVTEDCNLACKYCYMTGKNSKNRMSFEVAKAAVDYILRRGGLASGSLLVDVGCGTGISSRLFARRGLRVIGVVQAGYVSRVLDQDMLEAAAGAEERHAGLAGESDRRERSLHAFIGAARYAP